LDTRLDLDQVRFPDKQLKKCFLDRKLNNLTNLRMLEARILVLILDLAVRILVLQVRYNSFLRLFLIKYVFNSLLPDFYVRHSTLIKQRIKEGRERVTPLPSIYGCFV
jgi:hypothetical protein